MSTSKRNVRILLRVQQHLLLMLMYSMVCHRIISLGSHQRQAPFGRPRPNRSDRSHRPVRPLPRRQVWSDRSLRPVRSVPWCWPRRLLPHSRQFQVRLPQAELMNWRALFRHIPPNHMASHLFHPLCHKMFRTI